jgi:hypothetical protein
MRPVICLLLAAACATDAGEVEPTAPNLLDGDDKADGSAPLWAGLTSITIERYVSDPCNEGRTVFGDEPYVYGSWARERAGIRNVCFEVWSPGITDWDNPDFWRQLDVQAHVRYGSSGPFQASYVDSNGRRGNNRRYAFALSYSMDPTINVGTLPNLKHPFRILSESDGWAFVEVDMQVYFTVNGRALKTPAQKPYTIRYQNYLRVPSLAPNANGYVLHDIVTCEGGAVRFGSGAGFFAADMNHAKAAPLAAGLDGSLIYSVGFAKAGQMVQTTYGSQITVAGQTLPGFTDTGLRITPNGSQMTVAVDVYERATSAKRTLSATFSGCVKAPAN